MNSELSIYAPADLQSAGKFFANGLQIRWSRSVGAAN